MASSLMSHSTKYETIRQPEHFDSVDQAPAVKHLPLRQLIVQRLDNERIRFYKWFDGFP